MIDSNALKKLQRNLVYHIEEIQGVETLEEYQKRIVKAVTQYDRVVVSACHCVGKTFTLSRIILAIGSCFPGAKIITTAPTYVQVEKLLWSEIRTGHRNSRIPLGGKMLQTEWKIDDDWFAIGVSPKDDAGGSDTQGSGSRFQGFHGEHVIIVFDEATGIHPKRWVQMEGMMTSANVKFIGIGNPTTKASEFYKCFSSPEYFKMYLSCFDSPNLSANGIHDLADLEKEIEFVKTLDDEAYQSRLKSYKTPRPRLITLAWVVAGGVKWGLSHPLFQSKVLGQFPEEDENALFHMNMLIEAQKRPAPAETEIRSIGVDPARFGSDSSVITVIEGNRQVKRISANKVSTTDLTGKIVHLVNSLPRRRQEIICVDATGIGAGVIDQLREVQSQKAIPQTIRLKEVHFGAQCENAEERTRYANLKAKIFVELSDDMKSSLQISEDSVYLEELPTILYKFDTKGRYVIESKDDYKKRTGMSSPDNADSLAIANYGRNLVSSIGRFDANFVEKAYPSKRRIAPIVNVNEGW